MDPCSSPCSGGSSSSTESWEHGNVERAPSSVSRERQSFCGAAHKGQLGLRKGSLHSARLLWIGRQCGQSDISALLQMLHQLLPHGNARYSYDWTGSALQLRSCKGGECKLHVSSLDDRALPARTSEKQVGQR